MTYKETLNKMCYKCECNIGKSNQACPYRSISNDYCDEYESIKNDLELLDILLNAIHLRSWEEDETTPAVRIELSLGDLEKVIKRKKEVKE